MSNEKGNYEVMANELRVKESADAVLLGVVGGNNGNGITLVGTLDGEKGVVNLLENLLAAIKGRVKEHDEAVKNDASLDQTVPDRPATDEQMAMNELNKVAFSILQYARAKTGFLDEGYHALALAMSGLCAMHSLFGGVTQTEAKARAREVLNDVLKMEIIAAEVPDGEFNGIVSGSPDDPDIQELLRRIS